MSNATLQSAIPVLPVADVPKAVAFSRDRLGFTPLFEYGPYAGVGRGPIEVHLDGAAPGQSPVACPFNVTGGTKGAGGATTSTPNSRSRR